MPACLEVGQFDDEKRATRPKPSLAVSIQGLGLEMLTHFSETLNLILGFRVWKELGK